MSKTINTKKPKKSKFKIPISPFITFLEDLEEKNDRGALAALRRGLQHELGTCQDMYPYVIPWLENVKGKWDKDVHYLIASLFAYHPSFTRGGDMGDIFRIISMKKGENKSLEQRFVSLLRSNPEDLPLHMRQAVSLAKSENIPIDWHELFFDLKRWNSNYFPPYEKWAQSFWKKPKKENEE